MRKVFKIGFPIICVLIVVIAFWMIFDIKNKVEEMNYGTDDIAIDSNTINEDRVNNEISKENNTTTQPDKAEDNITNTNVTEELADDDTYSSDKFEQAKKLVQSKWGEDKSVYFTNEGINGDGLYLVAVRSKDTTEVKNYFTVNLETKKVEIDY